MFSKAFNFLTKTLTVIISLMMKKVKSTGKVGRSSFFDRIKLDPKESTSMKENININHIRQSSYKLERSKSHRKGHSLQRKIPIVLAYPADNHKEETVLREVVTEQNTINFVPDQFTVRFQHSSEQNKNSLNSHTTQDKQEHLANSLKDLFKFLHLPHPQPSAHQSQKSPFIPQTHSESALLLTEQQEMLSMIKIMWQVVIKMKEKKYFKEEVYQLEQILKKIVLKIARPKLQILEECSKVSLKVPPFKYSSPNIVASFKEESKQSSVNHFQGYQKECTSNWMSSEQNKTEEQPSSQDLEFKKIMYILDDHKKPHIQYKITKDKPQNRSNTTKLAVNLPLEEPHEPLICFNQAVTKQMRKSKSHLSSFNSQQTQRTNPSLVYEQQKINNSYSNDKLYLKNIVKKAKNTLNITTEHSQATIQKPSEQIMALNTKSVVPKEISLMTSQQCSKIIDEKQQFIPSLTQDIEDSSIYSQSYQISSSNASRQKTFINQQSQSKRTTLNNIINMLNKKYNKNIQMQPRRLKQLNHLQ